MGIACGLFRGHRVSFGSVFRAFLLTDVLLDRWWVIDACLTRPVHATVYLSPPPPLFLALIVHVAVLHNVERIVGKLLVYLSSHVFGEEDSNLNVNFLHLVPRGTPRSFPHQTRRSVDFHFPLPSVFCVTKSLSTIWAPFPLLCQCVCFIIAFVIARVLVPKEMAIFDSRFDQLQTFQQPLFKQVIILFRVRNEYASFFHGT
jgi:hypothetical protein